MKFSVYRELSPNVPDASGEVHTVVPSDTYLAVDHMAHDYSQPHPHMLKCGRSTHGAERPT